MFCMFLLCFPHFSPSSLPVSETTKWQLLFPKQPRGNHDSETRLHPPLEENETERQRVNTTVLRERWRSGGETTRRKMETETERDRQEKKDGGKERQTVGEKRVNVTRIGDERTQRGSNKQIEA